MRLRTNIGLAVLLGFAAARALAQEPAVQPTPASASASASGETVTLATDDETVDLAAATLPPAEDAGFDVAGEAFARMDSDRDGQLSLEEFEKGIRLARGSQGAAVVYQRLPARFRALDRDTSGYLEAGEFAELVQRWRGPGPAPGALAPVDRSGDGRIDFREFAALMAPRENTAGEPAAAATP